ncbi:MAG TPA: hypothetical protein ENG50_04820 [Candidatus Altiarchaeales archaeon]|nr:hypothetical protein [Candidatus Altiarchaeales archaeon]
MKLDFERTLRFIVLSIIGGILYFFLSWIPLLGTLLSGFFLGKKAHLSRKESFFLGIFSGLIGILFLYLVFFSKWEINLLMFWMLMIWHLSSILFLSIGIFLGSFFRSLSDIFKLLRSRRFEFYIGDESNETPEVEVRVICPRCYKSNPSWNKFCEFCGARLE